MSVPRMPFVRPHKPGNKILLIIPNYWGMGADLAEAKANCLRYSGKRPITAWAIWSVHEKTTVNGMGSFIYPVDEKPVLLCSSEEV